MPSLERDLVERNLTRKGFVEEPGDHKYFKLMVDGKYTGIFTKTSRGTKYKTLGDDLVGMMARQLKLTKKQFSSLVECTMTGEEYRKMPADADEL